MKKLITALLAGFMALSLTACSGNGKGTNSQTTKAENTANNTQTPDSSETSNTPDVANLSEAQENGSEQPANEGDNAKVLVAYFSATNTTAGVAKNIAQCLNADLYEIVPEVPYTSEDLDYHDNGSRTTSEMSDPDSRPAISGSVDNIEQYDIVFLGYPIWWGDAPRIMSTFVESCDLSGKTVVPFCTSGSSGVGSSSSNLEKLTSGATWLSGTRFGGSTDQSEIAQWINGLGLNVSAE